jgi:hypothetical protein
MEEQKTFCRWVRYFGQQPDEVDVLSTTSCDAVDNFQLKIC